MFNSNVWKALDKYLDAVESELKIQLVNRPIDMVTPYVDQFIKGKLQLLLALRQLPAEVEQTIQKRDVTQEAGKAGNN